MVHNVYYTYPLGFKNNTWIFPPKGDVSGRIAIMVDDVIDDVQSFVDAATGEFKKKKWEIQNSLIVYLLTTLLSSQGTRSL